MTPVALRYAALGGAQAPGIDEPELDIDQRMVVARYGDDWKVVGDATWSVAVRRRQCYGNLPGCASPMCTQPAGTSVIASYPVRRSRRPRPGLLPDAVQAVESFWGSQWPRRVAVVTTGTAGQFTGLSGAPEADGAAAAATVFTGIDADKTVRGQRIVLTPNARQIPAPALGVVPRHEITHVATRSITSVKAPLWVTEDWPSTSGARGPTVGWPTPHPTSPRRSGRARHPAPCRPTPTSPCPGRRPDLTYPVGLVAVGVHGEQVRRGQDQEPIPQQQLVTRLPPMPRSRRN